MVLVGSLILKIGNLAFRSKDRVNVLSSWIQWHIAPFVGDRADA